MNPAEFANIAAAEQDFWWYRGMRRILFRLLDPIVKNRTIRTVLEAGCGTGYNAAALSQRYGWDVCPLDLDMAGLRYGRSMGVASLTRGDITQLPFRSNSFDAVASLDVVVHLPRGEEGRALEELSRVLMPGGLMILRVSALDILRSRHSEFTSERQRFTAERLIRAVTEQDIKVLRCTYANTLLFPIALAKFRLYEPLTRQPARSGVQAAGGVLNRLLSFPLAAESELLAVGVNMPIGQSIILIGEKRQ
jgi:ubiquinone/menaquinone biosynthesis C-methylase UbiE